MNVTKKIISICVIVSILSSIVSYVFFENMFNSSLSSENERLTGVIEKLNQENMNLTRRLDDAENLIKPNLVTSLGWYLHKSTDPVNNSRNTLTIYGSVQNTGVTTALNCSLIIKLYNNSTLLQTSEIHMGDIQSSIRSMYQIYPPKVIQCSSADSVTRIEVTPIWS